MKIYMHLLSTSKNNYFYKFLIIFLVSCGSSSDNSTLEPNPLPPAPPLLSETVSFDNTLINENDNQSSVFITSLEIDIDPSIVKNIKFTVIGKPDTLASQISNTYGVTKISQDNKLIVPIYGLYENYLNNVQLDITFSDNSTSSTNVSILTEAHFFIPEDLLETKFVDTIIVDKAPSESLPISFFLLKSKPDTATGVNGFLVLDIDLNLRWYRSEPLAIVDEDVSKISRAVTFHNNSFVVLSDHKSDLIKPSIIKYNLDGSYISSKIFNTPLLLNEHFYSHHDLRYGKNGYLIDMNVENILDGILIEQVILEISEQGEVIKEFDFGKIISNYMIENGDDPTTFITNSQDWFHSNAIFYDSTDDSLLVSSRENFIIKIGYENKDIKWIYGDPTKKWYQDYPSLSDISISSNSIYPMGQHSLSVVNGNLMLFNNGTESFYVNNTPVGDNLNSSLVQIMSIDEENLTAVEEWSYDGGFKSPVCSNIQHLPEDDLFLINYSSVDFVRGSSRESRNIIQIINSDKDILMQITIPSEACNVSWQTEFIDLSN